MARSTAFRTASWSKNALRTASNDPPPGRPLPRSARPPPYEMDVNTGAPVDTITDFGGLA
jgi:hypothetical protein